MMGKREEQARRAAAMLEAGEDAKTVAAACGYKTTSAMLTAMSMVRNRRVESGVGATGSRPCTAGVMTQAPERPSGKMPPVPAAQQADGEGDSLEAMYAQRQEIERRIKAAEWCKWIQANMIAEDEGYRVIRERMPGGYIVTQKGIGDRKIYGTRKSLLALCELIGRAMEEEP